MRLRVLIALALLTAVGCGTRTEHPPVEDALENRPLPTEVVATVDGGSIGRAEFEAYWQENPQMNRREVLDALTRRKVLVAHALKRGLGSRPETSHARKSAMVQALLEDESEDVEPDDEVVEEQLVQIRARSVRPRGYEAHGVVAYVAKDVASELEESEREAVVERAESVARRIRETLGDEATTEEMRTTAETFAEAAREPLQVRFLPPAVFVDVHPQAAENLPQGWRPAPAFAEPLSELEPGEVTPEPIGYRTAFYLFRLDETYEELSPDDEELRPRAVEAARNQARAERIAELSTKLRGEADYDLFPEVIAERHQKQ